MKKILIKNGRLVDPANNLDKIDDVLIEDGKIAKIGSSLSISDGQIIEASGKIVMPGLVDMHVHLREPGREDKETIFSGTRAAIKGGVTSVLAMPNTNPAMDSVENIKSLKYAIKKDALCNVFMSGAITKGRLGKELTEIASLKNEGVIAISDDGSSVDDGAILLNAFKEAGKNNLLTICHSEDKTLSAKGVVNLGFTSTRLGFRGISNESEYKRVERDIKLAESADSAIHIAHVSTKESVDLIARAKKKGVRLTCETAPHYFSLTENDVLGYDTNKKMNPPLRSKNDCEAIKDALLSGVIDVIASDHAPHTENEKEIEFDRAEFGVIGLETILSVSITELLKEGLFDWPQLVKKLSLNPARILGINKGNLAIKSDADLIVVAPLEEWVVEKKNIVSKSKNCAFLNKKLRGVVEYTILHGQIVFNRKQKV